MTPPVDEPSPASGRLGGVLARAVVLLGVLVVLWGIWEGYKWLWETTGWSWPFIVNDRSLPHAHDVIHRLWLPAQSGGPPLVRVLLDNALFTARAAVGGFLLGAVVGFCLGTLLHLWVMLRRGLLPFVVASQTVPILAIAPMVVIWLGGKGLPVWVPVSVIAAYLTFFPVTVNTLRGLDSTPGRSLELMRSLAASETKVLWSVKVPSALPYLFSALKIAAPASVVGAIIAEPPASIQEGLGGAIVTFNQYYSIDPTALWATNLIAALLGLAFFGVVVLAEHLVVRSAPENVA